MSEKEDSKQEPITIQTLITIKFYPPKNGELFLLPDNDDLGQWLKDGLEKNTPLSGYLNVADDWLTPFNDAFYCEDCCQCFPQSEHGAETDEGDICKDCLEGVKETDPELYKDLTKNDQE